MDTGDTTEHPTETDFSQIPQTWGHTDVEKANENMKHFTKIIRMHTNTPANTHTSSTHYNSLDAQDTHTLLTFSILYLTPDVFYCQTRVYVELNSI